jgi:hypothetical protein
MLTANTTEINLGSVRFGVPYNFKFILTNSGSKPITITRLIKSCGSCTEASIDKSYVPPGDRSVVTAIFTPGSTGIQMKSLTVEYTEDDVPMPAIQLIFKATVDG